MPKLCRSSLEQKELRAELLAVSTQLTKASTEISSADSATEAAVHEMTILRAKLAEAQGVVQTQREAAQKLQDICYVTEQYFRQQLQHTSTEFNQQRYVRNLANTSATQPCLCSACIFLILRSLQMCVEVCFA